jgi:hypothetical protein
VRTFPRNQDWRRAISNFLTSQRHICYSFATSGADHICGLAAKQISSFAGASSLKSIIALRSLAAVCIAHSQISTLFFIDGRYFNAFRIDIMPSIKHKTGAKLAD